MDGRGIEPLTSASRTSPSASAKLFSQLYIPRINRRDPARLSRRTVAHSSASVCDADGHKNGHKPMKARHPEKLFNRGASCREWRFVGNKNMCFKISRFKKDFDSCFLVPTYIAEQENNKDGVSVQSLWRGGGVAHTQESGAPVLRHKPGETHTRVTLPIGVRRCKCGPYPVAGFEAPDSGVG